MRDHGDMRASSSPAGDRPERRPDASAASDRVGDVRSAEVDGRGTTMTLDPGQAGSSASRVRDRSRAQRLPMAEVDRWLSSVAVGTSVLALVILGGLPVPAVVSGLVLLAFWLAGPGAAVV